MPAGNSCLFARGGQDARGPNYTALAQDDAGAVSFNTDSVVADVSLQPGPESSGIIDTMSDAIISTMDSAGRLVLPKAIRDEAELEPGMPLRITCRDGRIEIEPAAREVRLVRKGRMHIAVPVEDGESLSNDLVRQTTSALRGPRR